MYEHRKALEREFENQMHTFDKEMERLKSKHRQELEQRYNGAFNKEAKDVVKVNKYSKQNLSYIIVFTLQ